MYMVQQHKRDNARKRMTTGWTRRRRPIQGLSSLYSPLPWSLPTSWEPDRLLLLPLQSRSSSSLSSSLLSLRDYEFIGAINGGTEEEGGGGGRTQSSRRCPNKAPFGSWEQRSSCLPHQVKSYRHRQSSSRYRMSLPSLTKKTNFCACRNQYYDNPNWGGRGKRIGVSANWVKEKMGAGQLLELGFGEFLSGNSCGWLKYVRDNA